MQFQFQTGINVPIEAPRAMKGQSRKQLLRGGLPRVLRANATDAERTLWRHLRRRHITGFKFRRQHPYGNYVLDFACLEAMLVVEVDGGQHASRIGADAERTASLERAGFRVLRFWNDDVLCRTDEVLEEILRALARDPSPPQPSP